MTKTYLYLRGLISLPRILPGSSRKPSASCEDCSTVRSSALHYAKKMTASSRQASHLCADEVHLEELLADVRDGGLAPVGIGVEVRHYLSAQSVLVLSSKCAVKDRAKSGHLLS